MGLLNHNKADDIQIPDHSDLAAYKREIELLQKIEESLQHEMKDKYVVPLYDDLEKLQAIISELPEGMTKFMAHVRIEELKRKPY